MSSRTDIHRPSQIIPADYEFVTIGPVQGAPLASRENVQRIERDIARTGGHWATHEHGGNCHVCGSVNLIWWICYRNVRTNEYIKVGEECAYNLDASGRGVNALNLFRKAARLEIGVAKGKAKAQQILAESGLSRAWDVYETARTKAYSEYATRSACYKEQTIVDIVSKLVKWGSISVNQGAFLGKLIAQIDNRAQIAAQRAVEAEAAAPCPTGRIVVTGTVLSTKLQDSQFGSVLKMLVRDDSGFKVWCTVPSSDSAIDKGARVTFTVSVEPSGDDPKFGFGKRPAKLEVLQEAAQAVA